MILAVFLHMFQMAKPDGKDNFGLVIQNTAYSCWVILLGARLDSELFDLEGFEFPSEVFATLGGSICYALAGISTMLNVNSVEDVVAKGVIAFILCLILLLEFILLIIDN